MTLLGLCALCVQMWWADGVVGALVACYVMHEAYISLTATVQVPSSIDPSIQINTHPYINPSILITGTFIPIHRP